MVSQIEIKYGNDAHMLKWEDFTGWLKADDLLLLYRRRKFFSTRWFKWIDVIDLNQITQEEAALFREMLGAKVKQIA